MVAALLIAMDMEPTLQRQLRVRNTVLLRMQQLFPFDFSIATVAVRIRVLFQLLIGFSLQQIQIQRHKQFLT